MYYFSVLTTPRFIFQNSTNWLLMKIKAYNCVSQKPKQRTQVCTPMDLYSNGFDEARSYVACVF